MAKNNRSGTLSSEERKFILDNMHNMEVEDIAKQLNRSSLVVEKVIRTQMALPQAEDNNARWHLRKSVHWPHLKSAFNEKELNTIEDQYVKYVDQFGGDIVATEEVQVLNLIKVEILMERNLTGKKTITENVKRYKEMVESILNSVNHNFANLEEEDRATIMDLEDKISGAMQAESSRTTEYVDLLKQHNALTEKVMGSRDQRIKQILDRKVSFTGLVKELIEVDKQEKDSRFLELYKKSTEKELSRLSKIHTYADNVQDNPIICAETIERFEAEEKKEESNLKSLDKIAQELVP